jgi:hypothetical protein
MPAEIYSKTGTDVADAVKRQFGDPDGRQITDDDIHRWINAAQQEIVSQNPILKETLQTGLVAGQGVYTYPAERVQYIEAIHYRDLPLEPYTFQEAQNYILQRKVDIVNVDHARPVIWYERNGEITIYPAPNVTEADCLKMYYVRRPEDLALLSSPLGLPDRYFQRVIDLVLTRAYQLDENWEAAGFKQKEFAMGMEMLANQENTTNVNTYPSVTVRIEDL